MKLTNRGRTILATIYWVAAFAAIGIVSWIRATS